MQVLSTAQREYFRTCRPITVDERCSMQIRQRFPLHVVCTWCGVETKQHATRNEDLRAYVDKRAGPMRAYVDAWSAAIYHLACHDVNGCDMDVPCTGCPTAVRTTAQERVRFLSQIQDELGMLEMYGLPMYDSVGCPTILEQRADRYDAVVDLDVAGIGVLHDYTVAKVLTGDFCADSDPGGGYQIKMWNGLDNPV
eukprot:3940079-Rhodomonas_salina.1